MNKIIRQSVIILTNNYTSRLINLAELQIEETKNKAERIAFQLNFPENCYEYEIFDVFYPGDCGFYERPMLEKPINDVKEMLARASARGKAAKYTYVIDGEYDKDGIKFCD